MPSKLRMGAGMASGTRSLSKAPRSTTGSGTSTCRGRGSLGFKFASAFILPSFRSVWEARAPEDRAAPARHRCDTIDRTGCRNSAAASALKRTVSDRGRGKEQERGRCVSSSVFSAVDDARRLFIFEILQKTGLLSVSRHATPKETCRSYRAKLRLDQTTLIRLGQVLIRNS